MCSFICLFIYSFIYLYTPIYIYIYIDIYRYTHIHIYILPVRASTHTHDTYTSTCTYNIHIHTHAHCMRTVDITSKCRLTGCTVGPHLALRVRIGCNAVGGFLDRKVPAPNPFCPAARTRPSAWGCCCSMPCPVHPAQDFENQQREQMCGIDKSDLGVEEGLLVVKKNGHTVRGQCASGVFGLMEIKVSKQSPHAGKRPLNTGARKESLVFDRPWNESTAVS